MISVQTELQMIQSIIYFIAALIPIYLAFIIWKNNNSHNITSNNNGHFRNLSMILAAFILIRGIYHATGAVGFSLLAKGMLEPLSFATLFFLSVIYLIDKMKAKRQERRFKVIPTLCFL